MHPQSCEESELGARHPHARRAHDVSVHCRWPGVLILWRVYQERATSGSDVLSERGSLSLPSLPPPASVLPPLTVEQRRCGHGRRMLHPTGLSKRCATAQIHLQPTPHRKHRQPRTQPPCTPSLSCCDVYDVRCDPSDGAGAGVAHTKREVCGARSRRWERSSRHVGIGS